MLQRRLIFLAGAGVVLAVACARDATGPSATMSPGARAAFAKSGNVPGSNGVAALNSLIGCTPRDPQYGTARIGPSGGELIVGPHRLVIPPGALTTTVDISGTAPTDGSVAIYLEPTGLSFKKPAGLILDASNCADVPGVVYINELGVPETYIQATYSNWWHTVAAPIDHFSGYAIAF